MPLTEAQKQSYKEKYDNDLEFRLKRLDMSKKSHKNRYDTDEAYRNKKKEYALARYYELKLQKLEAKLQAQKQPAQ